MIGNEYIYKSALSIKILERKRKNLPNYYCSWPNTPKFIALITTNNSTEAESTCLKRLSS